MLRGKVLGLDCAYARLGSRQPGCACASQHVSRPSLSAIVCTMGRSDLLPDCLTKLAASLRQDDELVVVEAGGSAASALLEDLPAPAPRTVHLQVAPPGKCRQLNAGLRAAQGTVALLTDDDVRVEEPWADEMAECFADPTVGIACGRVLGLSRVPGSQEPPALPPGDAPFETWRFAHGAAMAVRRQAAFDSGGFDERLGPGTPAGGEDHDFVLRVRRRGWRVVIAGARPVRHLDWRTGEEDRRNALSYERGGGAVVGAALRRSPREGGPVLRRRLAYQRAVLDSNREYGVAALGAFVGGLLYGLRLGERDWLVGSDVRGVRVLTASVDGISVSKPDALLRQHGG